MIKVSVIIPTYRRSEDICRALDSVLNQTIDSFEVIVVDDNGIGTIDGEKTSDAILPYLNLPHVHYIQHDVNRNGSAARNSGLKIAKGKYISFLDDDDTYHPDRLLQLYNMLENLGEEWGACYSSYVKLMPNGKNQISNEKVSGNIFLQTLMRAFYLGSGSNIFVRRSVIDIVGSFNEAFLRNQDLEFLIRVTSKFKMAYVDSCLMQVHYDIRTTHLTYNQQLERENLFRNNFAHYLDGLSEKERRSVIMMYDLDWMRYLISQRKYLELIKYASKAKIPLYVYFNYFKYIINRIRHRTCYGFVVNLK